MYFLKHYKENPDFLNNYLKYYSIIELSAETSVDEAYFDLRSFFRYLKLNKSDENIYDQELIKNIKIDDITLDDMNNVKHSTIDDFIFYSRNTLNNSPKTRNRKLSTLRKFFKYLFNNNLIHHNPTLNTRYATIGKRNPKYLTLNESKKMLSQTIQNDCKYKIRNYTMTCLFLNCGMRLAELIQINLTDIKLDEMTLRLKGKGNKERIIYLNVATKEAIEKYLNVRTNLPKSNPDYNALFLSERNKRISKRMVQTIIGTELNTLFDNNSQGYHTHTLRHTSATLLYNENDIDIRIIQSMLGHSSLASTEIYAHVSNKKLKEFMQNFSILDIKK